MRLIPPHRRRCVAALACLTATVCVSACRDASSDPLALLTTQETESALDVGLDLPALPGLDREGAVAPEAIERWHASWSLSREDGRRARRDVYGEALAPLAARIGVEGVRSAFSDVETALAAAAHLREVSLPSVIDQALERAEGLRDRSSEALATGNEEEALAFALEAADALREVGPQSVAVLLLARADAALEGLVARGGSEPEPAGAEELERGRRLVDGAREALQAEDYTRAIRRAFYACQILEAQQ